MEAFGLAMMFKLPHSRTTKQLLGQLGDRGYHTYDPIIDLPDAILGRAPVKTEHHKQPGLKGRVSFEPAVATTQPTPMAAVRAVLASPKASYYPTYIRQPADGNDPEKLAAYDGQKRVYASYTPLDADHDGVPITNPAIKDPQLAG